MDRASHSVGPGRIHKPRASVAITQVLVLMGALIWVVLAVLLAVNAHPAFPDDPLARNVMAVLSLAAGLVLLVLLVLLRRRHRPAYFVMLAALAASALALFFDDVGLVDLVFLAVTVIPLVLLVRDRSWYLGASRPKPLS